MSDPQSNPLAEGLMHLDRGELDAAIRGFQRVLRTMPDSFPARLNLAKAYDRKARATGEAAAKILCGKEFAEAIRVVPAEQDAHGQLIDAAAALGRSRDLRRRYEGAWSGLPFAKACLHAIDEAGTPVAARSWRPSVPPVTLALGTVIALMVAALAWQARDAIKPALPTALGGIAADPAPEFSLRDLSGEIVTLSSFRGHSVVIIDFWATWCGPCKATLPAMHALRAKYRNQGVEVLNVNIQESNDQVSGYLAREGLDLRVPMDVQGLIARSFGVRAIPALFVIDKRGGIAHKVVGAQPGLEQQLEDLIKKLL